MDSETRDKITTISCGACHSLDQQVPVTKEMVVQFDTTRWDTDNIHQGDKFVCNTDGLYLIEAHAIWRVVNKSVCQITLKINGDKCIATDRQQGEFYWNPFSHCSRQWPLKKGDYIQMVAWYFIDPNAPVMPMPFIRRADHWDSPEFVMTKLGDL